MAKFLGVLVAALVALGLTAAGTLAAEGRWQQVENNPSCAVWNANPQPNETVTWSGACANGKAQGRGTQVWRYLKDGEWKESEYTGEMKDGKVEGRWQQYENNSSCAVWNSYPQPNQTVTWSSACANGKAQGRGAQVWRYLDDGEWKEGKYTGEMKDGKHHGRGVYVGANGDRYEGDWKDDKQHGRGVYEYASGSRYEGDWKDSKFHGRGVIVFANGDKCDGDWRDGRLLGTGKGWRGGRWMKCYMDGNTIEFTD